MALEKGTVVGPYEVVAPIGAGGMGEVYKGRDTRLDRDVAIKILPAIFAEDAQLRLRFNREAKTISQLTHPNICTLYDVGEATLGVAGGPSVSYLVMELLDGESLSEKLKKGPLPVSSVLRWGAQIADALARAHRNGVVHRDLKPGNVMISGGEAKLLDFGLAKSFAATAASDSTAVPAPVDQETALRPAGPLTQEGAVIGTYQYMSPEQLAGEEADARSDIFALGCVLYEMASGRPPFEGKTRTSLVASILATDPRPLNESMPSIPPALEHVILKCLEKDPESRWHSAHDVAEELRWIGSAGSQSGVSTAVTPHRRRTIALPWIVAALSVAALVAVVAWSILGRAPMPSYEFEINPPPQTSFFPFDLLGMELSPDGTTLAFAANGPDGRPSLWLRSLGSVDARPLPETAGASYPFWSPDGRYIGFFADGYLRKVDVHGGPPQTICEALSGRGASWGEDGTILLAPTIYSGIQRVPSSGGKPVDVTILDTATAVTHRWPRWLPGGTHFLYVLRGKKDGAREPARIILSSADGREQKVLIDGGTNAVYADGWLLFGRETTLMAQRFDPKSLELSGNPVRLSGKRMSFWEPKNLLVYAASGSNALAFLPEYLRDNRLTLFDASGREVTTIEGASGYSGSSGAFSPDGRYVAFVLGEDPLQQDIWLHDLERSRSSRLTFEPGVYSALRWTPDSSHLYFSTVQKGAFAIYRKSIRSGGTIEPVVDTGQWNIMGDIAPDGRSLAINIQSADGGMDLWLFSIDDLEKGEVFLKTPANEILPSFSPDGRWIAFASDETGGNEVYLRSTSGPEQIQVTTGGASRPIWSSDGGRLYYLDREGYVMYVSVEQGDEPRFSEPRRLFEARTSTDPFNATLQDVSHDGQRILVLRPIEAGTRPAIHLVTNWTKLLPGQ